MTYTEMGYSDWKNHEKRMKNNSRCNTFKKYFLGTLIVGAIAGVGALATDICLDNLKQEARAKRAIVAGNREEAQELLSDSDSFNRGLTSPLKLETEYKLREIVSPRTNSTHKSKDDYLYFD